MGKLATTPKSPTERKTQSHVDTVEFTREEAAKWEKPDFQRELRVNKKVVELSDVIIADGGVIPGILTFGKLNGRLYLIDGQHRRESFLLSELEVGYADARFCTFDSMAAMGAEYVNLNSRLVSMRPDDILRGLEASLPVLRQIRKDCPFIGYGSIRRSPTGCLLGMSVAIRCWGSAASDIPKSAGFTAASLIETMTPEDAAQMSAFYNMALSSWGRDVEYQRLWSSLNMVLCAWLYKRLVLSSYSPKTKRMSATEFKGCLTSLSANASYLDWLVGRNMTERDRAPAYNRIKSIFAKRVLTDTGVKILMPAPAWAHGYSSTGKLK